MRSFVLFFIGMLFLGSSNILARQGDEVKGSLSGDAAKSDPQGVVIGNGTAIDKYLPVAPWWGYSYSQTIYLQQEINVSGQINEISYYYNGGGAWTDDIVIYMGTTDKISFTSESDWVAVANLTQVYAGPLAVTAVAGWVTLVLDTPFDYNNSQNLVVAVDENSTGSHNDSDDFHCTEFVNASRSLAFVSDDINPDPAAPPNAEDFSGWSPDFIPNTTFGFGNTVADADGNVYQVVTIGDQEWMDSNLKTTTYNDGTPISEVTDNTEWAALTSEAYSWYNNDVSYKDPYGALYNGYAVNTNKLCPAGWHVPTREEWSALATYLGGSTVAGGKLKVVGTEYWDDPNTGATNEVGFNALPNGVRGSQDGVFNYRIGSNATWWTSSPDGADYAYAGYITSSGAGLEILDKNMLTNGLAVRCMKGVLSQVVLPAVVTSEASNIAATSATLGGEVTENGGAEVTARGVVWSTGMGPTVESNDGMTTDGAGTGTFTSELKGLTAGGNYYVRAYATNQAGTAYGAEVSFTTTSTSTDAAVISSAAGGNWDDAATWTAGVVPVSTDSVVINGPVGINGNYTCDQLYVAPDGLLENENALQGYTLTVNGNLVNEGVIRDNPDFDIALRVLVYGDVTNAGTMSVGELALGGTSSQVIRQTGTQPFTMEQMKMWYDATETVLTGGDVTFEGTEISLGNLNMVLNGNLTLTGGGLLSEVSLDGQGYVLNCSEKTLLGSNTVLTNIILDGTTQITTNTVTFGVGVVNKGVVENGDGLQSYLLEVTGDLINEDTIRNNSAFETVLNIKVLQNVMDTGSMMFGELQVDGAADQEINFINPDGLTGQVVFYSNLQTGGPYQWTKDGNDISGETSENLVFSEGLTPGDAGIYTCVSDGTTSRLITVIGPAVAVDPLPIPFSQGFEEGVEGWSALDMDDDGTTWTVYSGEEAYEGTHAAWVEWNSAGNNDWLVSPLLEIPVGTSADLSFMAKSGLESFLESFDVKVISEDGETKDHIASVTDVPLSYTEYTYSLDNYAGQNIYLAVVCVSLDKYYLFLDNFSVKVTPTITTVPTAAGITYGDALSAATLSGGAASVDGTFAYDDNTITPNAGTYSAAITFTPTDAANYNTVSGNVDVAVAKATQTITFNALNDVTKGDEDFQLTATSESGLEISYSSSNTEVATVSGNIIHIVGAGTTLITASQEGNENYIAAEAVTQELVVNVPAFTDDNIKDYMLIYPNPTKNYLFIKGTDQGLPVTIKLYSITGTLIYTLQHPDLLTPAKIDLSHLEDGYYLIRINNDEFTYTRKIMKK